jgi:hypothetical protein
MSELLQAIAYAATVMMYTFCLTGIIRLAYIATNYAKLLAVSILTVLISLMFFHDT